MKENYLLIFCVFMLALLVGGCSTYYVVPGFDGAKRPKDKVGLLIVPKHIQVLSINGEKMDKYLLSDIAFNYQLLPGLNHIRYRYSSLWAVAGANARNDKSPAEVVESKIQSVDLNVIPGSKYRFKFKDANSWKGALVLTKHFEAILVNDNNIPVAKGVDTKSQPNLFVKKGYQKESLAPESKLNVLKKLWDKASAEDKQRFLKWAIK